MAQGADATLRHERPVGVCARCRSAERSFARIGRKCARLTAPDRKCPGLIRTAIEPGDWSQCSLCHATGRAAGVTCPRCDGDGWIYIGS